MHYLPLLLLLLISVPAHAKEIETYGIIEVMPWQDDMLNACKYLGELHTRSVFGGFASKTHGKKGNHKRLYKKAHELGASHILFADDNHSAWDSFVAGSAHAFNCASNDPSSDKLTQSDYDRIKSGKKNSRDIPEPPEQQAANVANVSGSQIRSVNEEKRENCEFLKSITKGKGGSGDGSDYVEQAMNAALTQAAKEGADSYFVVDVDVSGSSASVVLEALRCK
jgi:hypothetical protein